MKIETVLNKDSNGRPRTSKEIIDCVRQSFLFFLQSQPIFLPYSYYIQQYMKYHKNLQVYSCKHPSQMINQDGKGLQFAGTNFWAWRFLHREFILVMKQFFMFQGNWTHTIWESED